MSIDSLFPDVLLRIISYLDYTDLRAVESVCSSWKSLVMEGSQCWKKLLIRKTRYGGPWKDISLHLSLQPAINQLDIDNTRAKQISRLICTALKKMEHFAWDKEENYEQLCIPDALVDVKYGIPQVVLASDRIFTTGYTDHSIRMWSRLTGQNNIFTGHKGSITRLLPSPEFNQIVYSCSSDGTIRVWDTDSGKQIAKFNDRNRVYCIQVVPGLLISASNYSSGFNPDGEMLSYSCLTFRKMDKLQKMVSKKRYRFKNSSVSSMKTDDQMLLVLLECPSLHSVVCLVIMELNEVRDEYLIRKTIELDSDIRSPRIYCFDGLIALDDGHEHRFLIVDPEKGKLKQQIYCKSKSRMFSCSAGTEIKEYEPASTRFRVTSKYLLSFPLFNIKPKAKIDFYVSKLSDVILSGDQDEGEEKRLIPCLEIVAPKTRRMSLVDVNEFRVVWKGVHERDLYLCICDFTS